jgi:hypothetical protein
MGQLVNQAFIDRLSSHTQKTIRSDLLGQVCSALREVSRQRTELLHSRYKLQSALREVLELKRMQAIRPSWGSW